MSRYKEFFIKDNINSLLYSSIFLVISLFLEKIADTYVKSTKGVVVPDLILSHLQPVDVTYLIVQGALILTFVIIVLLLIKPRYINFTLKTLSIFILTRSFFISLTHLGAYPNQLVLNTNTFGFKLYDFLFNTSNDFFFSGHTGLPYLMALIFWKDKLWRYIFLILSGVFGISVLLAHIHYSIDVFAAPLITYSIFCLSKYFFVKDYKYI